MRTTAGPIGVFDSGFGGLTIFRGIKAEIPQYDFLYLGDNARTPYGNRSFETVLSFTTEAVNYLFNQGCPLIVLACNTASAKALRTIQQNWLPKNFPDRRVLGVIRPTAEEVSKFTITKKVGLWATTGTVKSESFRIEIQKLAPGVEVFQQACPLLVPLVEAGELTGGGLEYFIRKYWEETQDQCSAIDTLLLACTHYPLIYEQIRKVVPPSVRIVSQDKIVPGSLVDYLARHPEIESKLIKNSATRFLTTEQETLFNPLATVFMRENVSSEKVQLS